MFHNPYGYIKSSIEGFYATRDADCELQIEVHWKVLKFMATELSEGQDLRHMLTLSGDSSQAVAWPCSEYVKAIWPDTGPVTLHLIHFRSRAVSTHAVQSLAPRLGRCLQS